MDTDILIPLNAYENLCKKSEAIEIIKNKGLDIYWLYKSKNVEEYNLMRYRKYNELNEKEYDLLKEVLE